MAFTDEHRHRFGVEPIITVLREHHVKIAPSSYYAFKSRPPSPRSMRDAELLIELLISIALFVVLWALVIYGVSYSEFSPAPKNAACNENKRTVQVAVYAYDMATGALPSGEDSVARIQVLVTAGYLRDVPSPVQTLEANGVMSTDC